MQGINETLVRSVVEEVLSRLGGSANRLGGSAAASYNGRLGIFTDVDEAVAAARAISKKRKDTSYENCD